MPEPMIPEPMVEVPAIVLRDLRKAYDTKLAVDGLTLAVPPRGRLCDQLPGL